MINDRGNITGKRIATLLHHVQVSKNKQYIAYSFFYDGKNMLEVVKLNDIANSTLGKF